MASTEKTEKAGLRQVEGLIAVDLKAENPLIREVKTLFLKGWLVVLTLLIVVRSRIQDLHRA